MNSDWRESKGYLCSMLIVVEHERDEIDVHCKGNSRKKSCRLDTTEEVPGKHADTGGLGEGISGLWRKHSNMLVRSCSYSGTLPSL